VSAEPRLIRVAYRRLIATKPYENAQLEVAVEITPDPEEKILPQIRKLREAIRQEVDAAAVLIENAHS